MANMEGGDTLIILDGTYTGSENTIDNSNHPPYGSDLAWTSIKAEHDGQVTFDGEGSQNPFSFNPGSPTSLYVEFEGIIWGRSSSTVVFLSNCRYVKFLRCGAYDAGNGNTGCFIVSRYSDYVLLEGCYAWGSGRTNIAAYQCDHVIFRNCVGRTDRVNASDPVYTFGMYSVDYGLVQNCIAIDSDQNAYYLNNGGDWAGGFATPSTDMDSNFVTYKSCIVLNSHIGGISASGNTYHSNDTTWQNCVIWDISSKPEPVNLNQFKGIRNTVDHCTFGMGAITYLGLNGWNGGGSQTSFRNNIVYGYVGGNGGLYNVTEDYGAYYNNTNIFADGAEAGEHTLLSTNPIWNSITNPGGALKYIVRLESGSNLSGMGEDGSDIGAYVGHLIGESGTLWGEAGYDTDTGISMWPFPNEDLIKTKMAAYTGGGVNGARGFAASGNGLYGGPVTLTSYIWEYLGNPCPDDICIEVNGVYPPAPPSGLTVE
jgi:hypothetical protein